MTCCGAPAGGRRGAQAWPGYPHHLPSTSPGTLKRTLGILNAAGGGPSLSTDRPGARWASRPSAPRPPSPLPRIRALEPSVLFQSTPRFQELVHTECYLSPETFISYKTDIFMT